MHKKEVGLLFLSPSKASKEDGLLLLVPDFVRLGVFQGLKIKCRERTKNTRQKKKRKEKNQQHKTTLKASHHQ